MLLDSSIVEACQRDKKVEAGSGLIRLSARLANFALNLKVRPFSPHFASLRHRRDLVFHVDNQRVRIAIHDKPMFGV